MIADPLEILLVDDSPGDVDLTLYALRQASLASRVQVARDGEEALDFLFQRGAGAAQMPQLILLDLKLPKVDGLSVLRRVKGDPRTQTIPIVILTSSKEEKDVVKSYQLGVNSYIQKPVEFDKFRETVRELGRYWLRFNQSPPWPCASASPGHQQ